MKKLIFLLFGMLFTMATFAQEPPEEKPTLTKEVVYNDVKDLFKTSGIVLDSIITKAVRVTGKAAENLWDILVQQQLVKSITNTIAILVNIWWIFLFVSFIKTANFDEVDNVIKTFFGGVVILSLAIYNITHLEETITGYVNPEYGAIRELMRIANVLF